MKDFLILLRIDLLCLRGFRCGMFWIGQISLLLRCFSLLGLRFWGRILRRLGFRGGFLICRIVRIYNIIYRSLLRNNKQINKSSKKNHKKKHHNLNHSKPSCSQSTNLMNFSSKCAKVSALHLKLKFYRSTKFEQR